MGEVDLVNMALIALGEPPIVSLDDGVNAAIIAKARYPSVRDSVLRDHVWRSARKRAVLSTLAQTPAWGFTYQFQLPSDFIKMVERSDRAVPYEIEGDKLLSDQSTFNIVYIYRLTDVSLMDNMLIEAIAARLAAEMSLQLTNSSSKQQSMWALYQDKLREARFSDSSGGFVRQLDTGSWLTSRFSSGAHLNEIDTAV